MPSILILAAAAAVAAAHAPEADQNDWTIQRVGGDREIQVSEDNGVYVAGTRRVDTPLPDGYPRPTPPGAIELKKYPSVRRADVSGDSGMRRGSTRGFWPLFRHIQSRDIAMTAPVEMEVRQPDPDAPALGDDWRMSFFYRSPDLGPLGEAENGVTVVDTEPVTVLSIGLPGSIREGAAEQALETLYDWLGQHADQWRRAGEPRILGYNAPMDPPSWQWSEVQIPVERIAPLPSAQRDEQNAEAKPADDEN